MAARGRKPAPANRSRQQIQRERALQIAVEKNPGADSHSLSPEQQLTKPPPMEKPRPTVPPAAPVEDQQQRPTEVKPTENHPPVEETGPTVKELDRQEVELSVCFSIIITAEVIKM